MGRVPVKVVVVVVGLVLAVAVPVGVYVHRSNQAVAEWRRAHSIEAVRGKTPRELIEFFGEPASVERDRPSGAITYVVYEGPDANYCGIEFADGAAAKVTFWNR